MSGWLTVRKEVHKEHVLGERSYEWTSISSISKRSQRTSQQIGNSVLKTIVREIFHTRSFSMSGRIPPGPLR